MKTRKLRFASLSLMVVGSLLLAACGETGGTPTGTAVTAPTNTTAPAAATDTPAAAPATATTAVQPTTGTGDTSKGTIKLVSSLPRTGNSKPQTDDIVA